MEALDFWVLEPPAPTQSWLLTQGNSRQGNNAQSHVIGRTDGEQFPWELRFLRGHAVMQYTNVSSTTYMESTFYFRYLKQDLALWCCRKVEREKLKVMPKARQIKEERKGLHQTLCRLLLLWLQGAHWIDAELHSGSCISTKYLNKRSPSILPTPPDGKAFCCNRSNTVCISHQQKLKMIVTLWEFRPCNQPNAKELETLSHKREEDKLSIYLKLLLNIPFHFRPCLIE